MPYEDMVAFCVLGPGPEYRIVDPIDKDCMTSSSSPNNASKNNLDNKAYLEPAKQWIQFGSVVTSSGLPLGRSALSLYSGECKAILHFSEILELRG